MAITVAGVTGKEMWESFRKGRAEGGPFVELNYMVAYAQADAFVDGVMGGIVSTGGKGGTVRTVPKLQCPTNPKLYAMRAEYVGVGEDFAGSAGGRPVFSQAIVTVHFEVPTWIQFASDDPGGMQSFPIEPNANQPLVFAECEIDFGTDIIKIPATGYEYASDNKGLTIDLTKKVGVTTYRLTRHYFTYLPHTTVRSLVQKINNTKLFGADRGCVLFDDARTRQVKTSDGTRVQSWELIFQVRERDWNEVLREDNGKWDTIVAKGDSTLGPYTYADLSPLFAYS